MPRLDRLLLERITDNLDLVAVEVTFPVFMVGCLCLETISGDITTSEVSGFIALDGERLED